MRIADWYQLRECVALASRWNPDSLQRRELRRLLMKHDLAIAEAALEAVDKRVPDDDNRAA